MKYFYDTEFIEGTQKKWFVKTKPTIELISIGIVCEDGREFYAVSKDFNLKEAWNRYDLKHEQTYGDMRNKFPNGVTKKVYWIRENVLKPIFYDWKTKDINFHDIDDQFTYKEFKRLLKKYGKTREEIKTEIKNFIYEKEDILYNKQECDFDSIGVVKSKINLYGYMSAYDHVVFCWIFGKMIDLPKGFPMYTIDLKQELDRKIENLSTKEITDIVFGEGYMKHDVFVHADNPKFSVKKIDCIKQSPKYPKQTNEHNALSDARFNYELYKFLEAI